MLNQQCLYPLFPPARGACVDFSLFDHLMLPETPHLLVLPSDLAAIAKLVPAPPLPQPGALEPALLHAHAKPERTRRRACADASTGQATVCVNPGRCSRGNFAEVVLRAVPAGGDLAACVRVDVQRLALF